MTPLAEFTSRVGPAPRELPDFLRERPGWAYGADKIARVWDRELDVIRTGTPVLGWVVMANDLLWQGGGPHAATAQVVYSFDPAFASHPQRLRQIAEAIAAQHAPPTNEPARQPWLRHLQDLLSTGYERFFHSRVSSELTGGWLVYHSTIVCFADRLPQGKLMGHAIPLLVDRQPGGVALVPPARYWPTLLGRQAR